MTNLFEAFDGTMKRNVAAVIAAGSVALLGACAPGETAANDSANQEQCSHSSDGLVDVTGICEQIISARGDH
jgi:hypothetical protein